MSVVCFFVFHFQCIYICVFFKCAHLGVFFFSREKGKGKGGKEVGSVILFFLLWSVCVCVRLVMVNSFFRLLAGDGCVAVLFFFRFFFGRHVPLSMAHILAHVYGMPNVVLWRWTVGCCSCLCLRIYLTERDHDCGLHHLPMETTRSPRLVFVFAASYAFFSVLRERRAEAGNVFACARVCVPITSCICVHGANFSCIIQYAFFLCPSLETSCGGRGVTCVRVWVCANFFSYLSCPRRKWYTSGPLGSLCPCSALCIISPAMSP